MKNRKATKKFERKQLKQTIEKRRKAQKFKKSVERRQFKKKLPGHESKSEKADNKKDIVLSKTMKIGQKLVDNDEELTDEEITE
jgi:hypothetical protein